MYYVSIIYVYELCGGRDVCKAKSCVIIPGGGTFGMEAQEVIPHSTDSIGFR